MTAALHELANTVDCPRKPKGCSAPAGEPCVNWAAHRAEGEHPPATRVPHPARLLAAQADVPQQRQIEAAAPVPAVVSTPGWEFDDDTPLPVEPVDDEEGW